MSFPTLRPTMRHAIAFALAAAGCSGEVLGTDTSGSGGAGGRASVSSSGHAASSSGVVSSSSSGLGAGGASMSSSVSSGSRGAGGMLPLSCNVAPKLGAFTQCGGSAAASSGGGIECDAVFCDVNGNRWEADCKSDGTCTCSFNDQVYCNCAAMEPPPQCGGTKGYGCCEVVIVGCGGAGVACMGNEQCCSGACTNGACQP